MLGNNSVKMSLNIAPTLIRVYCTFGYDDCTGFVRLSYDHYKKTSNDELRQSMIMM